MPGRVLLTSHKRNEEHLPNLLKDNTAIVDGQSQADPQFRTKRLYARLTTAEVLRQLIAQFGYTNEELPTAETIGTKLNGLGYTLKKSSQSPASKIHGTDAIFAQVKQVNEEAQILRISMDTKATV